MGYTRLVNNIYSSLPLSTSSSNKSATYDTCTSCHYLQCDAQHDILLRPTLPIKVKKPNGQILQSTKGYRLKLVTLQDEARESDTIPGIAHSSLIFIGKLCDSVCKSNFNQHTMAVTKYDKILLQCKRDEMTDLWRVPLQILDRATHQSNNIHQVNGKDNDIKYLHMAAFSPVQDTLTKAFKWGHFNIWPELMAKETNNMTNAEATTKGHLTQTWSSPRKEKNSKPPTGENRVPSERNS